MNSAPAPETTQQDERRIVIERDLSTGAQPNGGNRLRLGLDEREGEYQGYVVTICLPASFLSKVSKVRLQAA